MPRKVHDPRLAALAEQRDQAIAEFEKNYVRFRRAAAKMEKARQRLKRVAKAISNHQTNPAAASN